jgi:hypothetical protein
MRDGVLHTLIGEAGPRRSTNVFLIGGSVTNAFGRISLALLCEGIQCRSLQFLLGGDKTSLSDRLFSLLSQWA